jgi:hypothetical protein
MLPVRLIGSASVVAAAILVSLAGCSSPQTILVVTVEVEDYSVPLVTELHFAISSVSDPSHGIAQMFLSTTPGFTADGGLPPVYLPDRQPFTIDPNYLSGAVTVAVEGVDNSSGAVLARGQAAGDIVPNQQTEVTVTLHGPAIGCMADGGAADSHNPCDGGAEAGRPDSGG